MSLLSECTKELSTAKDWQDIRETLEYAFTTKEQISNAVIALEEYADYFRRSDKSALFVYKLVRLVRDAPWTVQEKFLKDNPDVAEYVQDVSEADLERLVFKDMVSAGDKIFKEVDFDKKAKAINDIYSDYVKAIKKYHDQLWDAAKVAVKYGEESEQYSQEKQIINGMRLGYWKLEDKLEEGLSKLKDSLLQYSSISQEYAENFVNTQIVIDKSIKQTLSAWRKHNSKKIDEDRIKKELAYIYMITNGRLDNILIKGGKENARSWARKREHSIQWSYDPDKLGSLYHEVGHHFEFANEIFRVASRRFIQDRATSKPRKLRTITGNYSYRNDEKAYPDNFSNPYVGKEYEDGATEVLSMGLQALGDSACLLQCIKDMEHLKFCIGCFTSNELPTPRNVGVSKKTLSTANIKKNEAWETAIDEAMPASFQRDLCNKGVERVKIISEIGADGAPEVVLKRGRKELVRETKPEQGVSYLDRFCRMAYLAICNFKELIPDADPKIQGVELKIQSYTPPKWFTPVSRLPRI